jgi:succinylglutamate desuccinylase
VRHRGFAEGPATLMWTCRVVLAHPRKAATRTRYENALNHRCFDETLPAGKPKRALRTRRKMHLKSRAFASSKLPSRV